MSNARRLIDPIAREAKKLGFVARSALKLSELDVKFSPLRGKSHILDLGCRRVRGFRWRIARRRIMSSSAWI